MKKILSLLGAVGLTVTSSATVVSCAKEEQTNFTFLDFTTAEKYSEQELYDEKQDLELVQNRIKELFIELQTAMQDLSNGNIRILDLPKMYKTIIQLGNQSYRYAIKYLSYYVIMLQKGWFDLKKEGENIKVIEITDVLKNQVIKQLKQEYLQFKKMVNQTKTGTAVDKLIKLDQQLEKLFIELGNFIEQLRT